VRPNSPTGNRTCDSSSTLNDAVTAFHLAAGLYEAVASSLANLTGISLVGGAAVANYQAAGSVQTVGANINLASRLLHVGIDLSFANDPRRAAVLRFRNQGQAEGHRAWLAVYTSLSILKFPDRASISADAAVVDRLFAARGTDESCSDVICGSSRRGGAKGGRAF
jgi:hypothetical protein